MGIFDFSALLLSELYWYSTPQNFLVKKEILLHRPVFIFQPTLKSRVSDIHSKLCQNRISLLGKMRSQAKVLTVGGDLREAQVHVPLSAIPAFDRIAGLNNIPKL